MNNERIAESELIITAKGTIYHLDIAPEHLGDIIITVGSPDRVKEVSKYFDSIEHKAQHREFITHTGTLAGRRISVISTGIGIGNIDIVFNEIDALVNIDFATRTIKPHIKSLPIIRLGTCGALQADIPVDSLIVSSLGIGLDNLLLYYSLSSSAADASLLEAFNAHTGVGQQGVSPYIAPCSQDLAQRFTEGYFHGITVTCPGFYGPQGRALRLTPALPSLIDQLATFRHGQHRITNFEMETAAIYGMGTLLGHQCLSISTAVANRASLTFSPDGEAAVEGMIKRSLEIIAGF